MATDLSPPMNDTMKQGRLFTSHVPHLIDTAQPIDPNFTRLGSLCGIRPIWPGDWIDPDPENTVSVCGNCTARLEAMHRARES